MTAGAGNRPIMTPHASGQLAGQAVDPALIEALRQFRSSAPTKIRVALATEFGRHYDRLVRTPEAALVATVLEQLLKDTELMVRQALAAMVATSRRLPNDAAARLAQDAIEVARPVLEQSPVLDDALLARIVRELALPYALAIARRQPLSAELSALMVAQGQLALLQMLLANPAAELADASIEQILASHGDDEIILAHVARRPVLPNAVVQRFVSQIGNELQWPLISGRRLKPKEQARLPTARTAHVFRGYPTGSEREQAVLAEAQASLTSGQLAPRAVLALLRDGKIGQMEAALAALAKVELRQVRLLLYDSDKRGLVALCVRAGFTTAEYVAFRMVLGLAEQAGDRRDREIVYSEDAMGFVKAQYERSMANPALLRGWFGQS